MDMIHDEEMVPVSMVLNHDDEVMEVFAATLVRAQNMNRRVTEEDAVTSTTASHQHGLRK